MNNDIPVKSLRTTFRIVKLLSEDDLLTFSEISDQLDQPKGTIYDHLQSLLKLRLINKQGKKYQISYEFLLIGDRRRNRDQLFINARSVIDELADTTGEHASLFVEEEGRGRTIYTKQGKNSADFKVYDGVQTHLPFTAPGKAFLSTLERPRIDEILDQQEVLKDSTAGPITRSELHEELEHTSERGFALDDQIAIEGMRGIAVPIVDKDEQTLGAISIYGPVRRLERDKFHDELVNALKTKKNEIELNINYVE